MFCSLSQALDRNGAPVSISVEIQDERGACGAGPWSHPLSTELLAGEHPGTCCLRFIDPYGDALFNQAQLPVLLAELRALGGRLREPGLAPVLRELLAFVQPAAGQVHVYVRFIGD